MISFIGFHATKIVRLQFKKKQTKSTLFTSQY